MAKVRLKTPQEMEEDLRLKLDDGKDRLNRLRVEFDASRATYQGIINKGSDGIDASMVAALLMARGQIESEDIFLETTKGAQSMMFLHSKLCLSEPAVTTKPFNRDYETKKAAQYGQFVVDHVRQNTDLQEVLEGGTYLNTSIAGNGIVYVGWNENAGRVERILDESGKELPEGVEFDPEKHMLQMEGDYEFKSVSPHNFIIDDTASDLHTDATWSIERLFMDVDSLLYEFPEHYEEIKDAAENVDTSHTEAHTPGYRPRKRKGQLAVWRYFEKHRPWNGMVGTYVLFLESKMGLVILKRDKNPYQHGELPYCMLTDMDVQDDAYGMSRSILAFPACEAITQLLTQVMANIELHGSIRLLTPEGGVPDDISTNHPAIQIPYNPNLGEKPQYLSPTSVTSDIWRLHNILESEVDGVYGQNEFSRGEIPREISSYAQQQAIEMDDKFRIRIFNKKKKFLKRLYQFVISLTIQYVKEPRMFKIAGKENSHQYEFFKGSDLKGEYGIYISGGPFQPVDPFAMKQQIIETVKLGIFEKAGGNFQKLISVLVDGDMVDVKDLFDAAKRVQEEEFMRMINGEDTPVQPYHEHFSHYAECAEFMQNKFFETLPDDVKKKIWLHSQAHKKEIAKLQALAQQANIKMPPGMPGTEEGGQTQPAA